MAHIVILCLPGHGHLTPALAVAGQLVDRGHRVTVPTVEQYREQVAASGATAAVYPVPESQRGVTEPQLDRNTQLPEVSLPEVFRMFLRQADDVATLVESLVDGDRPDLLVYDQLTWAGWLLADRWQLPHVVLYPSLATNEHHLSFPEQLLRTADGPTLAVLAATVAATRGKHGLPALGLHEFATRRPDQGIAFLTRSFQPRGDTFDDRFEFVGPCLWERISDTGWRPQRTDRPLLYVSFGTAFNDQPEFFRTVIDAFRDEPWQVVMAIGTRVSAGELGEIPANVELHEFAPQLEILRHASVFITHAGMGGVQEGLSFGVPLICVPQMPEQQGNAQRVVELGLGRRMLPEQVTAADLRTAVRELLADPVVQDRLAGMRADIAAAGGAARAADVLERFANR
ncbi:glycosyl transferase [Pseudonocardiaceae bacterium YIM PH 21723]|nr:glycosyl transferase [Pseudonocardiaceae bacterium YIM PH 21723]